MSLPAPYYHKKSQCLDQYFNKSQQIKYFKLTFKFQKKMAPRSQGKVALDNVHAFNIAVTEYKIKTCEKTLAEIEKILTVLSKITDFSSVTSSGSDLLRLLINCHYLVSSLDHKNNTVWSVVSLLTNISSYDRSVGLILYLACGVFCQVVQKLQKPNIFIFAGMFPLYSVTRSSYSQSWLVCSTRCRSPARPGH